MKIPNGFFGNGPGRDEQNTRDQDAYMRNRMATSTFAGVALVGMFCSCIWFACCRNSSSKTRKKARTWVTAHPETGAQGNPYSYDGYMDSQSYMQMNNNNDGVAPYMNPPCSMYGDTGLTNPYDFNDHFGFNSGGKAQMSTIFGGPASAYPTSINSGIETNLKDVPPSYTALFFAASDPSTGMTGKMSGAAAAGEAHPNTTEPRVTNIQPIHLKVTSSTTEEKKEPDESVLVKSQAKHPYDLEEEDMDEDFINMRQDRAFAPVSLVSVESDTSQDEDKQSNINHDKMHQGQQEKPPPYNPGYNTGGYMKF